jgi:Glycosyl transferase family 2
MRVTVVVLNYNYERFVDQAIASALAQTYPHCDVVVVDNGSTDDSLAVIQRFSTRVSLVRQATNVGQGQGYNLGFAAARGEWVLWLDADDLLDPEAVSRCMALVQGDTSKVQFPLRLINGQGKALGGTVPFLRHQGDVRNIIRRFGHYAGPPGSGNLYRRTAVAPYFPVPTEDWPICTDTVPFVTAAFHGQVVDTGQPLGSYRLHGKGSPQAPGYTGNYSLSMAAEVRLNVLARDRSLGLLDSRSGIQVPGPFLTLPPHVRHRIISWRLAPTNHPFPNETAGGLWRLMRQSVSECPGYSVVGRLLMLTWTAGVLFLPLPMAQRLVAAKPGAPRWARLLNLSRRLGA